MTPPSASIRAGTRGSRLALLQARSALARLAPLRPDCSWEIVPFSTPGDRDRTTDLRDSPSDFFTRDLDDALRAGRIDCAIHSAKDVPDPVGDGLDWFWLPGREDPRDVLIRPAGLDMASLPADARIGVSSGRREAYCRSRFPNSRLLSIRGTIEERLRQLDAGAYDLLVMAGAALIRLGLQDRVTEWIPTDALPPPEGQGALAVTFRAEDARFRRLRRFFVKAVTFAAAGVGSAGACTLESLQALMRADVVLHDTLFGHDLLDRLPPSARRLDVGKRCGRHATKQEETNAWLARFVRQGLRVVRLKGGDPGIFGRLAEEIGVLEALDLPYRVLPGVTSLTSATTGTGLLLTRRGVSRGFTVMTPREAGGAVGSIATDARRDWPLVFFMALSVIDEVVKQLLDDGLAPATPAAVVYGAGSDQSAVLTADLATIADRVREAASPMPGILIVGEAARHRYRRGGAYDGRRILLTVSDALQERAAGLVADYGGEAVRRPLIRIRPEPEARADISRLTAFDWVVLTSPSAVRVFGDFLAQAGADLRRVPTLVSCGGGTSAALRDLGLNADLEPASAFGVEGLLAAVTPRITPGLRVLRLRSDQAGPAVAEALRALGAAVTDRILYRNERIRYPVRPEFDAVLFASASAVESYAEQWELRSLAGRLVVAIGRPTAAALEALGIAADLTPDTATVEASLEALAAYLVRESGRT